MNTTVSFFRKSFLQILGFTLLLTFITRLYPLLISLLFAEPNVYSVKWGILGRMHSYLVVSLLMLSVPWLSLSFYSEFFYTRALRRKEFFRLIFKEYLKWFATFSAVLFIITAYGYLYHTSSAKIFYPGQTMFMVSMALYLVLIISSGSIANLLKIMLTGLPVFLFSAFFGNYEYGTLYIGQWVSWAMWYSYLAFTFIKVYNYNGDIDINTPGKQDDENRALSKLVIFSTDIFGKELSLKKYPGKFSGFFRGLNLITSHSVAVYFQMFFIISMIILFYTLKFTSGVIAGDGSLNGFEKFMFLGLNSNGSTFMNELEMLLLIVGLSFLIMLVNPRYSMFNREEFLFTRAVSKSRLYWSNFMVQGIFAGLLAVLAYFFVTVYRVEGSYLENFYFPAVLLTILWFYLAGETGIVLFSFFFSLEWMLTTMFYENTSFLFTGFLINIHTAGVFGIIIWSAAILLRLWDYYNFIKKEIGWYRGIYPTVRQIAREYIIPVSALAVIVTGLFYANPVAGFINSETVKDHWLEANGTKISDNWYKPTSVTEVEQGIFFKNTGEISDDYHNILKNPGNEQYYLDISSKYFDLLYRYTFRGNIYRTPAINFWALDDLEKGSYWLSMVKENSDRYYFLKALESLLNSRPEEALQWLEKADVNSGYRFQELMGNIKAFQLNDEDAVKAFEKSLAFSDNKSKEEIILKIGNIYWDTGLYEKSVEHFARAFTEGKISYFPVKPYYTMDLCPKIADLVKKYSSQSLAAELEFYQGLCNGKVNEMPGISERFHAENYWRKRFHLLDLATFYQDRGQLQKAESYLQSLTRNSFAYYGDLSMLQLQQGRTEQAKQSVKMGFHMKEVYGLRYNDNNNLSAFDYKLYLAQLELNRGKPQPETAKKALFAAPDTEKAWSEIRPYFISDQENLNSLTALKDELDRFYRVMDTKGLVNAGLSRGVEKTGRLYGMYIDNKTDFSRVNKMLAIFRNE